MYKEHVAIYKLNKISFNSSKVWNLHDVKNDLLWWNCIESNKTVPCCTELFRIYEGILIGDVVRLSYFNNTHSFSSNIWNVALMFCNGRAGWNIRRKKHVSFVLLKWRREIPKNGNNDWSTHFSVNFVRHG